LEADVNASILQQRSGEGPWQEIYRGPSTQWIDGNMRYDSTGPISVAFRVRVLDNQGKLSRWSNILPVRASLPSGVVTHEVSSPSFTMLEECYPNPFNPGTTIGFRVPGDGSREPGLNTRDPESGTRAVRIAVYDMLGREVVVLVNERRKAGRYTVHFDGSGMASGVYLCRLQSGGYMETRTLLLVR
jgi:hypothetical protein